jgi:hypothetical protein
MGLSYSPAGLTGFAFALFFAIVSSQSTSGTFKIELPQPTVTDVTGVTLTPSFPNSGGYVAVLANNTGFSFGQSVTLRVRTPANAFVQFIPADPTTVFQAVEDLGYAANQSAVATGTLDLTGKAVFRIVSPQTTAASNGGAQNLFLDAFTTNSVGLTTISSLSVSDKVTYNQHQATCLNAKSGYIKTNQANIGYATVTGYGSCFQFCANSAACVAFTFTTQSSSTFGGVITGGNTANCLLVYSGVLDSTSVPVYYNSSTPAAQTGVPLCDTSNTALFHSSVVVNFRGPASTQATSVAPTPKGSTGKPVTAAPTPSVTAGILPPVCEDTPATYTHECRYADEPNIYLFVNGTLSGGQYVIPLGTSALITVQVTDKLSDVTNSKRVFGVSDLPVWLTTNAQVTVLSVNSTVNGVNVARTGIAYSNSDGLVSFVVSPVSLTVAQTVTVTAWVMGSSRYSSATGSTPIQLSLRFTTTAIPTALPTAVPTTLPTPVPTGLPTSLPTAVGTTFLPTAIPTGPPTQIPTPNPTPLPSLPPVPPAPTPAAGTQTLAVELITNITQGSSACNDYVAPALSCLAAALSTTAPTSSSADCTLAPPSGSSVTVYFTYPSSGVTFLTTTGAASKKKGARKQATTSIKGLYCSGFFVLGVAAPASSSTQIDFTTLDDLYQVTVANGGGNQQFTPTNLVGVGPYVFTLLASGQVAVYTPASGTNSGSASLLTALGTSNTAIAATNFRTSSGPAYGLFTVSGTTISAYLFQGGAVTPALSVNSNTFTGSKPIGSSPNSLGFSEDGTLKES